MEILFSDDFKEGSKNEMFTIFRINSNLYQAKSDWQVIILWKVDNRWEGVSNTSENAFISVIGQSIDKFYSTGVQFT
jgi:hypothetical protein